MVQIYVALHAAYTNEVKCYVTFFNIVIYMYVQNCQYWDYGITGCLIVQSIHFFPYLYFFNGVYHITNT